MLYKKIKTINSHAGYARFLAECEDLPDYRAFIPTPRDIPSPYTFSASTRVMMWGPGFRDGKLQPQKMVFIKETRHKHFEVFEIDARNRITMSEELATETYLANK